MGEYNGNSFEMGRLWGELQGHMHHHGEALERQNDILLAIKDTLTDLPHQIATRIATPASAIPSLPPRSTLGTVAKIMIAAKEIMPPLREIIWALVAIAVSVGLIAPHPHPPGPKPETHTAE